MKQLETKIADLEMLEHHVVNFVSTFKGEDEPSATVANLAPAAEKAFVPTFKDQPSATVANLAPAAEKAFVPTFKDQPSATVANLAPAAEKVVREIASEQDSSTSSETPDAPPNLTLLNARDNSSGVSKGGESSRVWTPAERALLTRNKRKRRQKNPVRR